MSRADGRADATDRVVPPLPDTPPPPPPAPGARQERETPTLREALVLRPGDRVLVSFPGGVWGDDAGESAYRQLSESFPGVEFTVVVGGSIAKIEDDAP